MHLFVVIVFSSYGCRNFFLGKVIVKGTVFDNHNSNLTVYPVS